MGRVNFYKSDVHVDERCVRRAEEIIRRTSELLAHRIPTQRMLLICLIGLLTPNQYDVQGALTDADADPPPVETLLERWRRKGLGSSPLSGRGFGTSSTSGRRRRCSPES